MTNHYALAIALAVDTPGNQDPYGPGELWRTFQGGAPTLCSSVFGGNPACDAAFQTFMSTALPVPLAGPWALVLIASLFLVSGAFGLSWRARRTRVILNT